MTAAEVWTGWCALSAKERSEFAHTLVSLGVLDLDEAQRLYDTA